MTLTLIDYITGKMIQDIRAEGSRQLFEKFLIENRGYKKKDVLIDVPIKVMFKGGEYISKVDLIVCCNNKPLMAVRCVAGSLGSYEREIVAAARLVYDIQIPFAVSTNGKDALIRDVLSGKPADFKKAGSKKGGDSVKEGLELIPTKEDGIKFISSFKYMPFSKEKMEREMAIFRSYDLERNEGECDASPFFNGQIL